MLPEPMHYHTSVVMGKDIWFMQDSFLYVLDTTSNSFKKYYLPFVSEKYHCAVGNSTHTYEIAVGPDRNEVWVNKYPNDPTRWMKAATLSQGKYYPGCLYFYGLIFITGGHMNEVGFETTEILDTDNHNIREAGKLEVGRDSHRMMILDGQAAVVGGHHLISNDNWEALGSIEVYDMETDTWTTHSQKMRRKRYSFGIAQYQ